MARYTHFRNVSVTDTGFAVGAKGSEVPIILVGGTIGLKDAKEIAFGTSDDVTMEWDGTNFIVTAAADDSLIEVGDSATTQKSFDVKIYGNEASGASYWYYDASENLCYTTGVDLQFKDADLLVFGTGASKAGDVSITWDGTNLIVNATTDDSVIEVGDAAATQKSFDVKWYGNQSNGASYLYFDASEDLVYTTGVDLQFLDNDVLAFGTGSSKAGDVSITWDGTNLIVNAAADNSVIEVGDAAATQKSFDVKWYGEQANGASYLYLDASEDLAYTTGIDLQFKDSDLLVFGTGSSKAGDVNITWDGTNLVVTAVADDTLIEIGDATASQKSFDIQIYGEENLGTSYLYFDASANLLYSRNIDIQLTDDAALVFGTGAGGAGDAQICWNVNQTNDSLSIGVDATSRTVMIMDVGDFATDVGLAAMSYPTLAIVDADADSTYYFSWSADDSAWISYTGTITTLGIAAGVKAGDNVVIYAYDVDGTAYAEAIKVVSGNTPEMTLSAAGGITFSNQLSGDDRLVFNAGCVDNAYTDGGVIRAGTSSARVVNDTADMKFISLYFDDGATSGDSRGIYNRLYITGAGGGGESLRTFTTVENVAAASAHGAHISLSFGTSGSVTGQAIASRNTLHIPTTAWAGNQTWTALQAEIWSDGATSDPGGNGYLSAIRILNGGDATGMADVDDDCAAFDFGGWTSSTGNMLYGHTFRIRVNNSNRYVLMSDTENRLDLSTINVDAANTDGGVIKIGTSAARVTEDTADMKFISIYCDNGATSGDTRGIYNRLYLTGAGINGESFRTYTTVEGVTAASVHGSHTSLDFASGGNITGQCVASRNTLHIPNATLDGLTVGVQSDIYCDGASADVSGTVSFYRAWLGGDASGLQTIEDKAFLLFLDGGTVNAGNIMAAKSSAAVSHTLRMRGPDGNTYYIMVSNAQ